MPGKSDALENDLLKLIFNGTAIANLADNAAASPVTTLYLSLHSADPTDAGTQATNEITYTGYARIGLARTGGAWAVTGNSVSPVANIDFGQRSDVGSVSVTHVGIGTALSGAGKLLYSGAISPAITVAQGVVPRITTASTITED